jgi:hypothetical protein
LGKAELPSLHSQQARSKRADILQHYESIRPFTTVAKRRHLCADAPGDGAGRTIGTGGSSRVTLEIDRATGRQLAVKHISFPRNRADFMLEIETLAKLSHPCVLRLLGWTFPVRSNTGQIQTE